MTKEEPTKLAELWQKRDTLNKAEWTQLYQLVRRVLKQGGYSELKSLPLSIENYIDEFFRDKVFMPTTRENFENNALHYDNALKTFFRRYLIDRIEESKNNGGDDEGDEKLSPIDIKPAPPIEDDIQLLKESGLTPKQVKDSAHQFLQHSEEWVRLYLALHTCPDKDEQLALNQLAKNYQIPSYHHRARIVGITRKKGEFETGYEKTLLGQWLISLGLTITSENQEVIEVAFKILCWEALSLVEQNAL
jgi:hypothetical protein